MVDRSVLASWSIWTVPCFHPLDLSCQDLLLSMLLLSLHEPCS
uniref:Uncharacterized protein n=1 Tax=Rhizophora mucronata TaxID=61149 RepID=A0A2P2QV39_RHIMU